MQFTSSAHETTPSDRFGEYDDILDVEFSDVELVGVEPVTKHNLGKHFNRFLQITSLLR